MNKTKLHGLLAFLSLAMLFFTVVIHIHFVIQPIFFLALGLSSYLWSGRKALVLFLFLLPLINSTPDIFFNGNPFNYMGVALFYLSGMMLASYVKKEKGEFAFPGYGLYLLFLCVISISVFFVFLRWTNLTLSPLAFFRDTPVVPSGERLSFACIFPVITLALFSLAPFLASAIRFWRLKENEIFTPLKAGFCLSFLLALVQKWFAPDFLAQSWWRLQKNQVNGGFSDFNAFGFFAGAMFLYQALRLIDKLPGHDDVAVADGSECSAGFLYRLGFKAWSYEIVFLMIALAAVFVSGCRAAFLFVLLAVGYLIFSKKTIFWVKVTVVLALAVSMLIAGGTLKKRLQESVARTAHISDVEEAFRVADEVSSGRLAMLNDSLQMIGRFPISGVGAGNFLFYLKYLHFGDKAYLDLPLNQYLLIFSETGLVGGLSFILFLAILLKRQKKGSMRIITATIVFALLFNNFFWFPECLLLFWIFLSAGEWKDAPGRQVLPVWLWAVVVVFVTFHILDFRALHPENLTSQKGVAYDYGFWPDEKSESGTFSWTRGAAGKYFAADSARDFSIFCGAPYSRLKKEKMVIRLFWRGKLLQRVVFFDNQLKKFQLPRGQEGFLEIRVHPTFNLKAMNLGADPRELGVKFIEAAEPLP